jgi:type IV secretory pathway component VirB8
MIDQNSGNSRSNPIDNIRFTYDNFQRNKLPYNNRWKITIGEAS